jgi:cob(I)alamin adenosyltransferase
VRINRSIGGDFMDKGYIHVYTGNGKGKTTAALGISLRAICSGKKVYFAQFVKGMKYSELKAPEYLPNFVIEQLGNDHFIKNKPSEEDKKVAVEGLKKIGSILKSNMYDMVVLDEINIALYYNLFEIDSVIELLKNRNPQIEVIITGRYAPKKIIEIADLVTEMKEIKHYYKIGVPARVGIEK